jgi:hypothetical protein
MERLICLIVNTSQKISCFLDHHADPLVALSYARIVTSPATTSPSPPLGATVLSGAQVRVLPAEARGGDPRPLPWRFVAPHRRSRAGGYPVTRFVTEPYRHAPGLNVRH